MFRAIPARRSATALRRAAEGESQRTIVIALIANIVIAVAKLAGGLISGSTGLLAEAAHSAADSVNEIFLAIGLHRDRQPADAAHPLGHGRERFLWAFMAAIASFLIGGCVSIAMALAELKKQHPLAGGPVAWTVLGVSFAADGVSWLQSMRQSRRQAGEYKLTVRSYIFNSSDPVVRAVFFEDSAALVGICVAAIGLFLSRVLGTNLPDSIASLVIGLLLAVTAFALARPFADFLIGKSVPSAQLEKLRSIMSDDAAVEEIHSLRAMYSGPEEVVVMAKILPAGHLDMDQFAKAMDELDHKVRSALPSVADVFIDITATLPGNPGRESGERPSGEAS